MGQRSTAPGKTAKALHRGGIPILSSSGLKQSKDRPAELISAKPMDWTCSMNTCYPTQSPERRFLPTRPILPAANGLVGGFTSIMTLTIRASLPSSPAGGVDFLMTYDESPEILALIEKHELHAVRVVMKNTHHVHREELVITPRPLLPLSTAAKLEKSSQ